MCSIGQTIYMEFNSYIMMTFFAIYAKYTSYHVGVFNATENAMHKHSAKTSTMVYAEGFHLPIKILDKELPHPLKHQPHRHTLFLSTQEDHCWLSEFRCFVRAHYVEVIRAIPAYVMHQHKSNKIKKGQVGIQCRLCDHPPPPKGWQEQ